MEQIRAANFIDKVQETVAIAAVGASALRNQGAPIIKSVRDFLHQLDLYTISVADQVSFDRRLDEATESLLDSLSIEGRPWGTARKALNLFLRDSLYNRYLCEQYILDPLEPWLEMPLDSATVQGLQKRASRGALPSWPGLKHLTKVESDKYQAFAQLLAEKCGIARVHLDPFLWLENR